MTDTTENTITEGQAFNFVLAGLKKGYLRHHTDRVTAKPLELRYLKSRKDVCLMNARMKWKSGGFTDYSGVTQEWDVATLLWRLDGELQGRRTAASYIPCSSSDVYFKIKEFNEHPDTLEVILKNQCCLNQYNGTLTTVTYHKRILELKSYFWFGPMEPEESENREF